MLTGNWVNNLFALISALLLVWVWRTARREVRHAGRPTPTGSFSDAYRLSPHVYHNRQEIEHSKLCGCLGCEQLYRPSEVADWRRDAMGETAICPRCGSDSVVGSDAGFVLTPELVHRAHSVRFPAAQRRAS